MKDPATIADLAAQGQYVAFPFLDPRYAEVRHLVSARAALDAAHCGAQPAMGRAPDVFPEFEQVFNAVDNPTAAALVRAFPGPDEFLAAPRQKIMHVLRKASRGHLGEAVYARLRAGAEASVALPSARVGLKRELRLLRDQLALDKRHIKALQESMVEVMRQIPEPACLTSIPGVAPVSAAVFLGSVGDVRAYRSSRQVLKLAGMSSGEGFQRDAARLRPAL
jgi:transposase